MPRTTRSAKKRRKPDAHYEACRDRWERRRSEPAGVPLVEKPRMPVDPAPFLGTLQQLFYFTHDERFIELHRHLIGSDLIDPDTEQWSLSGTTRTRAIFDHIERKIRLGMSEREAIADVVAMCPLFPDALSFDAAWKRVERQLHSWRKALDKNQPKKV
jgi:hypothetical protein